MAIGRSLKDEAAVRAKSPDGLYRGFYTSRPFVLSARHEMRRLTDE